MIEQSPEQLLRIIEALRGGPQCPAHTHGPGNRRCILAAGHLDAVALPSERLHTTLLDDGRRWSWRNEADEQWLRQVKRAAL